MAPSTLAFDRGPKTRLNIGVSSNSDSVLNTATASWRHLIITSSAYIPSGTASTVPTKLNSRRAISALIDSGLPAIDCGSSRSRGVSCFMLLGEATTTARRGLLGL